MQVSWVPALLIRVMGHLKGGGGSIGRALGSRFYEISDLSSNLVRSTRNICEFFQV